MTTLSKVEMFKCYADGSWLKQAYSLDMIEGWIKTKELISYEGYAAQVDYETRQYQPMLLIEHYKMSSKYGLPTVIGEVVNKTQITIEHAQAVVELYDAKGHMIGLEKSFLANKSIAPGAKSFFEVLIDNTGKKFKTYRLHLKSRMDTDFPFLVMTKKELERPFDPSKYRP